MISTLCLCEENAPVKLHPKIPKIACRHMQRFMSVCWAREKHTELEGKEAYNGDKILEEQLLLHRETSIEDYGWDQQAVEHLHRSNCEPARDQVFEAPAQAKFDASKFVHLSVHSSAVLNTYLAVKPDHSVRQVAEQVVRQIGEYNRASGHAHHKPCD